MAKLSCRTRGNTSPQGKPRVYFACHPADFETYFDLIAEEILREQNCAVWYDEEPGEDAAWEEWSTYLDNMQLFVIPVTARFLREECRARTMEFAFAMKRHIPVLPLMQETGLESEFNRTCGDLQFLDRNNQDATAIRYEEKLRRYLASILVDDETAARVREAFDAYVFLSYRKKDRRFANDLMRLIHRNEFCRDIAIWYDEYLTPGENFNDAIREAMEKSRLFTLLVTPNLVNETNYVMTVEYPAAKEAGKPVVPIEMEATDRDALKNSYEEIPDCVDPENSTQLTEALTRHLRDIAIAENDSDPKHLFFIGLAYLSGIDVEVDHERAANLIREAAGKGLDEAVEKLVSMYRTGNGVARDYSEAIRWQEKLVELRKKQFDETRSQQDGLNLFEAKRTLGIFQGELGRREEQKQAYEQMQELAAELVKQFGTVEACRAFSISNNHMADVCLDEGNTAEALKHYEENLTISEWIAKEARTSKTYSDVSFTCRRLGDILKSEDRLAEAEKYYRKALETDEWLLKEGEELLSEDGRLFSEDKSEHIRQDLAFDYERMGTVCEEEGALSEAEAYYAKAMKLEEQLLEETRDAQTRSVLSHMYLRMGGIRALSGDPARAKEYYVRSLQMNEQLLEELGTAEAYRDLADICLRLGDLALDAKELPEAKAYFQRSLAISREQCGVAASPQARRDLSIDCERMGTVCIKEKAFPEAEAYYLEGLELRERLWEELGTVRARRDLVVSYNLLGDMYRKEKDVAKAKTYYGKCAEHLQCLFEESKTEKDLHDLAVIWRKLGETGEAAGDLEEAKSCYRRSLEFQLQHLEAWPESADAVRQRIFGIYVMLGDVCRAQKSFADAREYYTKCRELCEEFFESPQAGWRRRLALMYRLFGDLERAEGNLPKAREWYTECLMLCNKLYEEDSSPEALTDLYESCMRMGEISQEESKVQKGLFGAASRKRKKLDEAEYYYRKAVDLSIRLTKVVRDFTTIDNMAMAVFRLAVLDEANIHREFLKSAHDSWCTLLEAAPDNEDFRQKLDMVKRYLT